MAANGNSKFGFKKDDLQSIGNGHASLNGLEQSLLANGDSKGCLLNGHDLNVTSDLFSAAAKLISGKLAGGAPVLNAGGNGCQDPSVSTTQVTIPKDVSGTGFCGGSSVY